MGELATIGRHEEWYRDVPRSIRRQALFGIILLAVAFGGFGAWAFRAPLAAAVIAQGSFVATGQNKIVQHLEGGIIEEILVKEGDRVEVGEVLLRLDETASFANERELLLRQHRLEATEARLLAEYAEEEALDFPRHLEALREDNEIEAILAGQTLSFNVSRRSLAQDVTLLERNADALDVRRVGYATQLASHRRQLELLTEEHAAKAELLAKGLSRRPEVIAVERVMVEAEGQIGRLEAEIAEIDQIQRKYEVQIEKARSEYRQAALDELQVVQAELESIREKARKAQNVLARSEVTAPVSGTVVRLHYHTPGGVIETGKAILEILPAGEPLIIEAMISRTEIDSVRTGQHATVRLTALNQRTTPVLDGEVFYISADAIADTGAGDVREVYLARVSLPPDQIARVPGFTPTPGMPAEIMIQTEERTFAQYLAKPVVDSMSRAFREQ
ncbi:HlyD family type I secretion periplasmic adaptor subunit [Roseitranquillus sediminis]|uniref:HlyD family type I secretion periplasmic adaptor subunit n=1 Tax=Roseitranquillus sediminis TaxID=2809051 RepID=UPI001D0C40F1|nr:HlyD family type I secretion periplasmic adaptor subunit [Roseitranquillus sediminis]MBM9593846.1 HlyD family type I secretion periplasmic adaptor subunit [Roseitranquillus sediminis]